MANSMFDVLRDEGMTTLIVRYDYRTDKEYIIAKKEWDDDIQWCNFNKTFYADSLLTQNDVYLNNAETRALFEKHGQTAYLDQVFDLLRKGKFFGLDCYYNKKKDMRFTANLHNITLGINSKDYAVYTGGIRRHDFGEPEIEVLIDGLNLGRAQTYKNVSSKIPYGGGKITVQANPVDLDDKDELGFLAFSLDRVKFFTGPDMRYPNELADAMAEFSAYITAGPKNKIGSSGIPTAIGVHAAMKEAIKFHFNKDTMKGFKFALMGLGSVGYPQAELLIKDGAEDLTVCDLDPSTIELLKRSYPNIKITVVNPDEILDVDADILVPSAIGGFLTEDVINKIKFKMVFGGANNQLYATNKEEEIRLAKILESRGILYQECWVQNIGGVMSGKEMYTKGDEANKEALFKRIEKVCAEKTLSNLTEAKAKGITPNENAYRVIDNLIYAK